jgi:hypothetical protein
VPALHKITTFDQVEVTAPMTSRSCSPRECRQRSGCISLRIAIGTAVAFGCTSGTLAIASMRGATETVAAMQARDGRVLAREIRSAADRRTHTPSEVKTLTSSFGVHALDVLYRAQPGALSPHGAYVFGLITGPHGIEKNRRR